MNKHGVRTIEPFSARYVWGKGKGKGKGKKGKKGGKKRVDKVFEDKDATAGYLGR